MNDIFYKGKSLNNLGFFIKNTPVHSIAKRDFGFDSIAGRSGDLIEDERRYQNVEVPPYEINSIPFLVNADDSAALERELALWAAYNDGEYYEFRDSTVPGYFTKAVCEEIGELSILDDKVIETSLTFNRIPYWYSDVGQQSLVFNNISSGSVLKIENPDGEFSEPYIKVNFSGFAAYVDVNINGSVYRVNNVRDSFTIDREKYTVYNVYSTLFKNIDWDYLPIFKTGENTITIVGASPSSISFSSVEIIPRWRRL